MEVRILDSVRTLEPAAWDALAGPNDPFVERGFLAALEAGGAVGGESGWSPRHVTVWSDGTLVGAMPLYLKSHSYGEFIFDWAWAEGSMRLGAAYYPKLVAMAPLSPVTGQRLLVHPDAPTNDVRRVLLEGAFDVAERESASSLHVLFTTDEEAGVLAADARFLRRLSFQFHWRNEGYASFDDYLARFRAPLRKQTRKERAAAAQHGLEIAIKEGPDLTDAEWAALARFYAGTCARRGSPAYLPPAFFAALRADHAARVVAVLAYRDGSPVAGTLNLEKGDSLYGRYWGSDEEFEFLHFELSYYRLLERAIARGHARFEAGAQGIHKLRRGLLPTATHSVHWIRHPLLARAVADYVAREAGHVRAEMAELARHGPFHRGEPAP